MNPEKTTINPTVTSTMRLVKYEDLNHHGTLYAGRSAEWFVEAGFVSITNVLPPNNIVCLKIHEMHFTKPVQPGQIIRFDSKIIFTGKSSLITHIKVSINNQENSTFIQGFISFIHVGKNTKSMPHNINLELLTDEDKALNAEAIGLRKR